MDQLQNQEIEKLLESAKVKSAELNAEHEGFSKLREELKSKISAIKALHTRADTGTVAIESLVASIQKTAGDIDTSVKKIKDIEVELVTFSATFNDLRQKFNDPVVGIETNLRSSQETREKIDQKYEEVIKTQGQIESIKEISEKHKIDIEQIQKEVEEYKTSVADTLKLITSGGLTGSFIERRNRISKSRFWWGIGLIPSIIILSGAVLYIYTLQALAVDGFKDWHSWYRYLFTSPLVYLVYLCAHYYALERDYEERYAFKAVLSTSLESYIKLLSDKFPEEKSSLLRFTLETIATIYEKPYFRKDKKARINFAFKIVNAGIELDEKVVLDPNRKEE